MASPPPGSIEASQPDSGTPMSIDVLPVELLILVFGHVQEYEVSPRDPNKPGRLSPQWLAIRRVCNAWHSIADDHPSLWRIIDIFASEHTLDWFNLCLANSGITELELRFHAPDVMREVCDALAAHAGRIRTIWASGEETIRGLHALRPLFLSSLPKVQELHLDDNLPRTDPIYDHDRDTRFVLTELLGDLNAARLPALHTVVLGGIFLPWHSAILRNLRVLRLARWEVFPGTFHDMYELSTDQFLHALAACQRLAELSIDVSNTDPHIRPGTNDLPTISLPNLRRMELTVNQFEARVIWLPVLSHIRFPEACTIALDGSTVWVDADPPSYAKFLPNDPQCFPALANAVEATWHGPTAFSCKAAPAPPDAAAAPELTLALRDARDERRRAAPDPDAALAQFCEYLAHAPRLARLTMRTCVGEAAYAHAFRALSSVTELAVEYPGPCAPRRENVRRLLSALAGELDSGEAVLGGLRVLRLRGLVRYDGLDGDVAECLRIRRGGGVCDVEVDIDADA